MDLKKKVRIIPQMNVLIAFTACCCLWSIQVNGYSDNSVHIFSEFRQLITSTTLRWVSEANGQRPEYPVIATEDILIAPPKNQDEEKDEEINAEKNLATGDEDVEKEDESERHHVYICRAIQNGVFIPGQLSQKDSECIVSMFGAVSRFKRYEVLESILNSSRLSWVKFSKFDQVPVGAVCGGDEAFIARRKIDTKDGNEGKLVRQHLIGKIRKQGFTHVLTVITEDEKEEEFSEGEVLIEIEPVRYELAVSAFNNMRRKITRSRKELGSTILKNLESSPMHVDAVIAYNDQYSMYWGQGKSILKGLPTTIRLPNGTILEQIKWGISENEDRQSVYRVEAFLEPGTAVNVSLAGNQTVTEIPYTGNLVAIYPDDATRARSMTGSRREEGMKDLKATYSQAYFLSNFSLVPTTTTTTTTTTSTTTTTTTSTTTTTTTTPPPPPTTKKVEKTDRKHENMINDQAPRNNGVTEGQTSAEQSQNSAVTKIPATATMITALITSFICRIT